MSYQRTNRAKANFSNVYHAPTPHDYFALMDTLDYRIGEEAEPYFSAAVHLLGNRPTKPKVQMLDVGCSYGVGSALVKYRFSFDEIVEFFQSEASQDYDRCVEETRHWIREEVGHSLPIRCIGMDCSEEALRFAEDADLLDAGISKNCEEGDRLTEQETKLIRHCHLMTSTGAIGYITEKTLNVILSHLGKALDGPRGPIAVVTILRMFDSAPIRAIFQQFGFRFERVPGVRLRQRHFADEAEQEKTVRLLQDRGLEPAGWESEGVLYADLFAAAPAPEFPDLMQALSDTRDALKDRESAPIES